jgi:hypothetical protein
MTKLIIEKSNGLYYIKQPQGKVIALNLTLSEAKFLFSSLNRRSRR